MPFTPEFSDYPSLRRSKTRTPVEDESIATWRKGTKEDRPPEKVETTEATRPPAQAIETELSSILKRGHALSFAGLFLFTVVLYFRPYELSPFLSWTSNAAFVIALLTVLIFVPTQLGLENTITTRPIELKFLFFLVIAALLSIVFALDSLRAWNRFTEYLKVVLMFVVMINVVRTKSRLKAMLILGLVASIFFSVSAINDYRLGNLIVGGERVRGVVGGMFQNPNDLALHLVTMIPIAGALFLATRNLLSKLFYAATAIALVAGVVVTFSRGGFLRLAVTLAVFFAKVTRGSKIIFVGVLLAAAVALVVFVPGGYGNRISNLSDPSAINRQDDLKRSIYLTIRHPLFGVGMDNFIIYSNHGLATHNAYTQVSSELGVLAGACYLLFLFFSVKKTRQVQKQLDEVMPRPWEYYLAIGIQASLIGYMVSSFFASVAFLWYVYYLVGYAICLRRIYEASDAHLSRTTL